MSVPALLLAAAGVVGGILDTSIYRATATVRLVEDKSPAGGLSQLASQFGGLASIAGIKLPTVTDRVEAVAELKSASLAMVFIEQHDLQRQLFPRLWNRETRTWKSGVAPSISRTVERFDKKVRQIHEDQMTGLVSVSMKWRDPETAAKWANELVEETNERMRQRAVDEASAKLRFLEKQVENTTNVELRQVIYRLIQENISAIALANARPNFALYPIDSAIAPDQEDDIKPSPIILGLVGALVGLLIGALLALMRHSWWRRA